MKKIALHSAPRSGSSWVGSILDSSPNVAYRFQPLFSYTHKGKLNSTSSFEDIQRFFIEIFNTSDDFVLQKLAIEKGLVPVFKKKETTHIVYKEVRYHHILKNLLEKDKEIKVIGILRNPLAVINSWLRAPKEFKKDLGWLIADEWRYANKKNKNKLEEFNGYEKWKEVAFIFMELKEKYIDRFILVNYNDLLITPQIIVNKLFKFCDLDLSTQTNQFILDSISKNNKDPYSVYKIKTTDNEWEKTLPRFIYDEIVSDKDFQSINKLFNWI